MVALAALTSVGGCTEVFIVPPGDAGVSSVPGWQLADLPRAAPEDDAVAGDAGSAVGDIGPELGLDAWAECGAVMADAGPAAEDAALHLPDADTTGDVPQLIWPEDTAPEVEAPEEDADAGGDPVDCCAGVSCEGGEVCDPATCACPPPQLGSCQHDGASCDPVLLQAPPWMCVPWGPGGAQGVCRLQCLGPQPGDPNPCEEGVCGALPGTLGYCVPKDCDGFFDNTCGPDASCLPTLDGSNACVPDGPGPLGTDCVLHDECVHDALCIDGVCAAPDCSPFSSVELCDAGITCVALAVGTQELDAGFCAKACTVFDGWQCPDGLWCYPLLNTPEAGPIDGHCILDAPGDLGAPCEDDPGVCGEGLACVANPEEQLTCELLCDPTVATWPAPGACPVGRGCSPLLLTNDVAQVVEVMDFGSCVPDCTPWVPHAQMGCGATAWCEPMIFNGHSGECNGIVGALPEDAFCTESSVETSCGVGLMCLGVAVDGELEGVCRRVCSPAGFGGTQCQGDQSCEAIGFLGAGGKYFELEVGLCEDP